MQKEREEPTPCKIRSGAKHPRRRESEGKGERCTRFGYQFILLLHFRKLILRIRREKSAGADRKGAKGDRPIGPASPPNPTAPSFLVGFMAVQFFDCTSSSSSLNRWGQSVFLFWRAGPQLRKIPAWDQNLTRSKECVGTAAKKNLAAPPLDRDFSRRAAFFPPLPPPGGIK